ncbi:MAG: CapA family protein [Eubacteriales bacterium]|nr:CapA family protein [Eubacteriales bacterium]
MISFTATGDSLILEHFPEMDKDYEIIKQQIDRGNVRITNLETVLADEPHFANTFSGGGWITAPSAVLNDLEDLGFNFYACANNHAMDYSYGGLLSTAAELRRRKLNFAGIGESMSLASQPAYVQTPEGRVALFSVAALYEHQHGARAGDPHDGLPGRPGLNILRRNCYINVTEEQFRVYSEIAEMAGAYRTEDGGYCIDNRHTIKPAKPGETIGRYTTPNEADMNRILSQISASKQISSMTVVCMHAHANKLIESYLNETEPDYYLEDFVHRAIDAGADAVVGSGCHRLRGIEIYQGKPIFYSLGNFVFTVYADSARMPYDYLEARDLPWTMPGPSAVASSVSYDADLSINPVYYRSVIPYWEMEDGKMKKLELLPIALDMSSVPGLKGFPHPCAPELVIDDLREASRSYGTEFAVIGDRIEVLL